MTSPARPIHVERTCERILEEVCSRSTGPWPVARGPWPVARGPAERSYARLRSA